MGRTDLKPKRVFVMRFEMQAINQAGGAAVLSLIEIEMNSVELTQCKTVCVKAVHLCLPTAWSRFNPKKDCKHGTVEQLYRTECIQYCLVIVVDNGQAIVYKKK